MDPARPCELDVRVTGKLWVGFVAAIRTALSTRGSLAPTLEGSRGTVLLIEKQLAAMYAALLATEAITGTAPVTVRATYPMAEWA